MRYEKEQESYTQDFVIRVFSRDAEGKEEAGNSLIIGVDDMSPQDILDCLAELKANSPYVQAGGEFRYGVGEIRLPENMYINSPDMPIERIWYVAEQYGSMMFDFEDEFGGEVAWYVFPEWYSDNFVGKNLLENFSEELLDSFRESFMGIYATERDFVIAFLEEQGEMVPDIPAWIIIDYETTAENLHQMGYIYTKKDGVGFAYNMNAIPSIYPDTDEDCRDVFYDEVKNTDSANDNRMMKI